MDLQMVSTMALELLKTVMTAAFLCAIGLWVRSMIVAVQGESVLTSVVLSMPVLIVVFGALVWFWRLPCWNWKVELARVYKTLDYARFRDKLIPLTKQKRYPNIRRQALTNLAWIHSFWGEGEEAKAVCRRVVKKNKDVATKSVAYNILIQELILENDMDEAKSVWERVHPYMEESKSVTLTERFKNRLYGHVIREEYEEGLESFEKAPKELKQWVKKGEECAFWRWYMTWRKGDKTVAARRALRELPVTHKGYIKVMDQEQIEYK